MKFTLSQLQYDINLFNYLRTPKEIEFNAGRFSRSFPKFVKLIAVNQAL